MGHKAASSPVPLLALYRQEEEEEERRRQQAEQEKEAVEEEDEAESEVDSEAEDARLHPTRRFLVLCACTLVGFVMNVMVSVVRSVCGCGCGG